MRMRFEEWRAVARDHLRQEHPPELIDWTTGKLKPSLFGQPSEQADTAGSAYSVPKQFLELARVVGCHRDASAYALLYRVLWRITHGEPALLEFESDPDVLQTRQLQKAVRRDAHKMKAFVRFRKVVNGEQDTFIAWHRPDHLIVQLVAPFFSRRFPAMDWAILTPDESVFWDQSKLTYGPGVPAEQAPQEDGLEELWKSYYRSTFNPARVNVALMKQEMPVRHWPTLPEAELIPELLAEAEARVKDMVSRQEGLRKSAADFLPEVRTLQNLRAQAALCTGCELHGPATQTVFGMGSEHARLAFVGEQPGDEEDLAGEPFVGPAGRLLREMMEQANVDPSEVYLTNTVKHFKYVQTGPRRLHKKPGSREITACKPWLEAELQYLKPAGLLLLGATSAQAVLGRDFRLSDQRGKTVESRWCRHTIATWHPAAILRAPTPARQKEMQLQLLEDIGRVAAVDTQK